MAVVRWSPSSRRPGFRLCERSSGERIGRGFAWLDTGTHANLLEAAQFVETIERRQGFKIACLEEIAWRNGWMDDEAILAAGWAADGTEYAGYLQSLVEPE